MRILKFSTTCFTLFFCLFFLSLTCTIASAKVPYITTAELKAKMDAGEPLVLANALSSIEFNAQTIDGSVNIPAGKVKGNSNLPDDLGRLLIFYCLGPKCGKSRIAAQKAIKMGYTNVMVYNEGLPAWIKAGHAVAKHVKYPKIRPQRLKPQELQSQMASVFIMDIRGKKHKKLGKIAGAQEILLEDLPKRFSELPRDKKIVVIDHAGKQLLVTAKYLAMQGFNDVAILDGGVSAWLKAGLPVNK